jgi:bifunctional non-homologous end joining protein LigD
VRLYSRPGNDLTERFPLIVEALAGLRSRSCIIDGEAVACSDDGIARSSGCGDWRNGASAFLYAFDLIELNSDDLPRDPLEQRKADLARAAPGALRSKRRMPTHPAVGSSSRGAMSDL